MLTSSGSSAEARVIVEKAASRRTIAGSKRMRSISRRKYGLRRSAGNPVHSQATCPSTRPSNAPCRPMPYASAATSSTLSTAPTTWMKASRRTSMKPLTTARM